jgi:hypothetical protein
MGIFFKSKPKEPEVPSDGYKEMMSPIWEDLFKQFPIGKRFKYLGITMVVINRQPYCSGSNSEFYYFPRRIPTITTEYVDCKGVIKQRVFVLENLSALLSGESQ